MWLEKLKQSKANSADKLSSANSRPRDIVVVDDDERQLPARAAVALAASTKVTTAAVSDDVVCTFVINANIGSETATAASPVPATSPSDSSVNAVTEMSTTQPTAKTSSCALNTIDDVDDAYFDTYTPPVRRRPRLQRDDKVRVLQALETGTQRQVAQAFDLSLNSVNRVWKERHKFGYTHEKDQSIREQKLSHKQKANGKKSAGDKSRKTKSAASDENQADRAVALTEQEHKLPSSQEGVQAMPAPGKSTEKTNDLNEQPRSDNIVIDDVLGSSGDCDGPAGIGIDRQPTRNRPEADQKTGATNPVATVASAQDIKAASSSCAQENTAKVSEIMQEDTATTSNDVQEDAAIISTVLQEDPEDPDLADNTLLHEDTIEQTRTQQTTNPYKTPLRLTLTRRKRTCIQRGGDDVVRA